MAGILFFFPGERVDKNVRGLFERNGLGELLDPRDALPGVCEDRVICGPDGGPGTLCYWTDKGMPSPLAVDLDKQTWHKAKPRDRLEAGRVWFGITKSSPPTPEDLLRREPHRGVPYELADGNRWLVPIVRDLPQVVGYGDDGEFTTTFNNPRYQHAFEETWAWCEAITKAAQNVEEGGSFSVPDRTQADSFRLTAELLGLNYRINGDVLSCLGLVVTKQFGELAMAAGGFGGSQKKS